ncbi:MAG: DUF4294 domain-containing protein [Bacteroidetes bacterium]|nr:DUF4294 domain-containing protein [Bacteroidota bacterium]
MRSSVCGILAWALSILVSPCIAQNPTDPATDTVSKLIVLPEFEVLELRVFPKKRLQRKYDRLVQRVRRTYPLAKVAGERMKTYARVDATGRRRDRKELIQQFEQELREKYVSQLKRMSFADGRILLKLLDRQTEFTSYELLQEMKGGVQAMFWQGVAGMFDYDLKASFSPADNTEDKLIDEICRMIDSGRLN